MELQDFIKENAVIAGLKVSSKKQLLRELSEEVAKHLSVDEREVFDTLLQREKLGSTGVGNGVAIPHGKLKALDHVFGLLVTLDQPIDFDAPDNGPVDLIFVLLAPESAGADHLKALARIARLVRTGDAAAKLRASRTAAALYAILAEAEAEDAA
ncbi:MAG: PTS IIA-like nitrogen regulatory protein PtsN [Pseudomonadota bacterium]